MRIAENPHSPSSLSAGEAPAGPAGQRTGPRAIERAPLPYLLSQPAGRSPQGGKLPLLCFLHGNDEAAPTEIHTALTRHGPLRPENVPDAVDRFLIVAPQLPRAGDLWHLHADAVRAIVEEVRAEYGGDPDRTYLTGFSFGGNGVLDLGACQPEFWAALWAVDPTRVPSPPVPPPVWLSFGEVARFAKRRFIESLRLTAAELEPSGDRVHLDQGQNHVGSATLAYGDERIYRWLLSKRLRRAEQAEDDGDPP